MPSILTMAVWTKLRSTAVVCRIVTAQLARDQSSTGSVAIFAALYSLSHLSLLRDCIVEAQSAVFRAGPLAPAFTPVPALVLVV